MEVVMPDTYFVSQRKEYDGNGNLLYHGFCHPSRGTYDTTDTPCWAICMFEYDLSNRCIGSKWKRNSDKSVSFNELWDDRATLTYT